VTLNSPDGGEEQVEISVNNYDADETHLLFALRRAQEKRRRSTQAHEDCESRRNEESRSLKEKYMSGRPSSTAAQGLLSSPTPMVDDALEKIRISEGLVSPPVVFRIGTEHHDDGHTSRFTRDATARERMGRASSIALGKQLVAKLKIKEKLEAEQNSIEKLQPARGWGAAWRSPTKQIPARDWGIDVSPVKKSFV